MQLLQRATSANSCAAARASQVDDRHIAMALKPGNFGNGDFFATLLIFRVCDHERRSSAKQHCAMGQVDVWPESDK